MDYVSILVVLSLVEFIYANVFKNLTVISLNYAVSEQMVHNDQLRLEIDLNQHFALDDPDYRLVNHILRLSLPHSVFPTEKDLVSFEYQLILINVKTQGTAERECIVLIRLIDLHMDRNLSDDN
jgi:hypothetical protein